MQLRKRVKEVERLKEEGNSSFKSGALHGAVEKYTAAIEVGHNSTEHEATALPNGFLANRDQGGGSKGWSDTCDAFVKQSDHISESA
jgi:hypothetical protein